MASSPHSPAGEQQRSIADKLSDATASFIHFSLAPALTTSSNINRPGSHPPTRANSAEDLRIPPPTDIGRAGGGGAGGTQKNGTMLGETGRRDNHENERSLYPFAGTSQLLRRCTSELDLTVAPADEEEDEDFPSDEEPFRMRPPSILSVSSCASRGSSRRGIQFEDRSEDENRCFAVDASIRGFYSVGEKAGGFVVFDCEITTREGAVIRALRRYSAFVRLRNDLVRSFPRLLVPRLPPKSSLAKFRQSFLERRRQQLSFWLTTVLLHPETGGSSQVRAWICEP
ncbi:Phox-like protein [Meredithblackwellia eburnea MCA 4105]